MSHELITIGNYEFSPGIIKKFISFPIGISGTELSKVFLIIIRNIIFIYLFALFIYEKILFLCLMRIPFKIQIIIQTSINQV